VSDLAQERYRIFDRDCGQSGDFDDGTLCDSRAC